MTDNTKATDQRKAKQPGTEAIKPFFMLNSAEDEIFSANKYENANNIGIFIFISREVFTLSYVQQERIST